MRLSSVIIVEHRNSETRHFCCRPAKKRIVVLARKSKYVIVVANVAKIIASALWEYFLQIALAIKAQVMTAWWSKKPIFYVCLKSTKTVTGGCKRKVALWVAKVAACLSL